MQYEFDTVVKSLLSFILNNDKLSMPVYLSHIHSETDAEEIGMYPVIYIWNESKEKGSFSVSVNTKPIAHLLEGQIPRSHRNFEEIRDKVAQNLSEVLEASIISTCQRLGAYPSDVFSVAPQPQTQKRKTSYY